MILKWHNTIIIDITDETLILKLCRICCEEGPRGRKRDKEIDLVIHNIHVEKKEYGVYVPDTNSICTLGKRMRFWYVLLSDGFVECSQVSDILCIFRIYF